MVTVRAISEVLPRGGNVAWHNQPIRESKEVNVTLEKGKKYVITFHVAGYNPVDYSSVSLGGIKAHVTKFQGNANNGNTAEVVQVNDFDAKLSECVIDGFPDKNYGIFSGKLTIKAKTTKTLKLSTYSYLGTGAASITEA